MAIGDDLEWLADQLPGLARLAVQLTGHRRTASELLIATATAAAMNSRLKLSDYLDSSLRTILVRRYLSARTDIAAAHPAALSALTPRQRAVLVLKEAQSLPLAEIATTMDCSQARVVDELAEAQEILAQQGNFDLADELEGLAEAAPNVQRVLDQLPGRLRSRRTRQRTWLAAGAAMLALVVAIPIYLTNRTSAPSTLVRADGDWHLVHRVDPPTGWKWDRSTVVPYVETSYFVPSNPDSASDVSVCTVSVFAPGALDRDLSTGTNTPVKISGRPGSYVDQFAAYGEASTWSQPPRFVAWRYGERAWAVSTCRSDLATAEEQRTTMIKFARATSFSEEAWSTPFTISRLPGGYEVDHASRSSELRVALTNPSYYTAPTITISTHGFGNGTTSDHVVGTKVGAIPARLDLEQASLCLEQDHREVCITLTDPVTGTAPKIDIAERLNEIASRITLAPNLADQSTWSDINEALP